MRRVSRSDVSGKRCTGEGGSNFLRPFRSMGTRLWSSYGVELPVGSLLKKLIPDKDDLIVDTLIFITD